MAARKRRPAVLHGTTWVIMTGCGEIKITINEDDGEPREIISSSMAKSGTCTGAIVETLGRITNIALKNSGNVGDIAKSLLEISCQQHVPNTQDDEGNSSCIDAFGKVLMEYDKQYKERRDEQKQAAKGTSD